MAVRPSGGLHRPTAPRFGCYTVRVSLAESTGRSPGFATTRWSLVARAGAGTDGDERRDALSELCETYWYPVYAFARWRESNVEDARDLVQSFFTRLLERDDLAQADAMRGRFRSYLLRCFVHFRAGEWERSRALKRGGAHHSFSLDHERAEQRFRTEAIDADDPERTYMKAWARTLLEKVIGVLRREYEDGGKSELFDRLKPTLSGEQGSEGYRGIAASVGTTEGAVKVAAHRLRRRFAILLRREIAGTLRDPDDVEDEIRGLFDALG